MDRSSDLEKMVTILRQRGMTVALAESCTGGLIGSTITSESGASEFFKGSAVTYSNDSKESILGVKHTTLLDCGAVSIRAATEMAKGAIFAFRSDVAASVTGIAGPNGGSDDKPVGLVYISVTDGKTSVYTKDIFSGSREEIRSQAMEKLFQNVTKFIEGMS